MYVCSQQALKWFGSYLSGRFQKTSYKNTLSDPLPNSLGVPQGSIPGPLFFLFFINDLPVFLSSQNDINLAMFADDYTFLATGTNIGEVELRLNTLANDILNWTRMNSMALNIKKTKSMLITSPQKLANLNENSLSVLVEGQVIEEVSEA